jgi:hypothetical protein
MCGTISAQKLHQNINFHFPSFHTGILAYELSKVVGSQLIKLLDKPNGKPIDTRVTSL